MGTTYGYARDEEDGGTFTSSTELIHLLCDVVSKNGNLLLNIGPRADGTIPDGMQEGLLAIGEWLKTNGEAIYGSRPWVEFKQDFPDLRFTQKPGVLYAISMEKPVSPFIISLNDNLDVNSIGKITLLGMDKELEWKPEGKGVKVFPPKDIKGEHAWVFKINMEP